MFVTENNAGSQIKLHFYTATLLEQKNNYFGIWMGRGGGGGEGERGGEGKKASIKEGRSSSAFKARK